MPYEGHGTIKISREAFEKHRQRKDDMDVTWEEYIDSQAPDYVEEQDILREIVREETRAVIEEFAG